MMHGQTNIKFTNQLLSYVPHATKN